MVVVGAGFAIEVVVFEPFPFAAEVVAAFEETATGGGKLGWVS